MVHGFPSVVALGVALPLDEVLQLSFLPMTLVAPDGLDFVLFLVVDKVRWWPGIVFSMFFCLYIWGKEGGVEDRMYGPLRGEATADTLGGRQLP